MSLRRISLRRSGHKISARNNTWGAVNTLRYIERLDGLMDGGRPGTIYSFALLQKQVSFCCRRVHPLVNSQLSTPNPFPQIRGCGHTDTARNRRSVKKNTSRCFLLTTDHPQPDDSMDDTGRRTQITSCVTPNYCCSSLLYCTSSWFAALCARQFVHGENRVVLSTQHYARDINGRT